MHNIRIELHEKKNKYQDCKLNLNSGDIVRIICENELQKRDLIRLLNGTEQGAGLCVLGEADTIKSLEEYKRKIDFIDMERVNSHLSVKNYLTFFMMVTGIYRDETVKKLEKVFKEAGLFSIMEVSLNELQLVDKIKVRCLAAYLKGIECLVGNDLLEHLERKEKEEVVSFINRFFGRENCICLLLETSGVRAANLNAVKIL